MSEPHIVAALDQAMQASQIQTVSFEIQSPSSATWMTATKPVRCVCVPYDEWERLVLAINPLFPAASREGDG